MLRHYQTNINEGKTGWIQEVNKENLLLLFEELNIQSEGLNLESLRKTLRDLVKSGKLTSKLPDSNESDSEYQEISSPETEEPVLNMMNTNKYGIIEPFNGNNFEIFQQQLECIITLNDVPKIKQTPLLITNLTSKVLETLNHLCTPEKPIQKEYQELIRLLDKRYTKATSIPLERVAFRARNQKQHELIEDYVMDLKKLAKRCDFKDMEDQVKEKFIDGVNKPMIKFELLKNGDASLERLIIIARTVDAALQQSHLHGHEAMESAQASGEKEMFQVRNRYNAPAHTKLAVKEQLQQTPTGKSSGRCFVCGKDNHIKSGCTLKNKYCSECGKQGHLFKVCRLRQTKKVEVTEENTDYESDIKNLFEIPDNTANIFSMYMNYTTGNNKVPPQFVSIAVEGKEVKFEVDTGSEVSTLTLNDHITLFPDKKIENCNITFKNFDQSLSKPIGIIKHLNLSWNNVNRQAKVYVVSDDKPRILGRDWLNIFDQWPLQLGTTTNDLKLNVTCDPVKMIKDRFSEVFTPGWGDFKGECITLKLKSDSKPKFLSVRQVPLALKDKVKDEINRLLLNKRIEPIKFSQWGTPVVPVLKQDGSVRLCGDFKVTLNPYLEIDHFPLPHIDSILDTLKGGEYYSELDLKEAYLQAPLDPSSQELTVITTEFGIFKYLYLPYGVSSGPGSFQRLMNKKLSHIPNVIVFIDNIYIRGSDFNDMCKTLEVVLTILKESGLKLKPEKCKFFKTSIVVFGYKVNKEGISIIKENVNPIINLQPPESITMLRSFLGKINYYARFLKNMATIIAPLNEMLKSGKFKWTKESQYSFELIKKKLSTAQSLHHFDASLPLILSCDASSVGISAVLSNRGSDNVVRPIAFASKKLNDTEQKYCTLDKEAMAVVYGVTKFYNYVYGREFELETDNAALVRIFGPTKAIPKMAAKRLQHYAIFLSAFTYKIRHIPSNKNPADYLSRQPETDETTQKLIKNLEINTNYIDITEKPVINWEIVQTETNKDILLSQVIRYSTDGWPDIKLMDDKIKPYFMRRNEISIDRNCLFWGHRIIIPTVIRDKVLIELHKSHFGSTRMIEIAKSYFWWPKLNEEIVEISKQCENCLAYRNAPAKTSLKTWPIPPSCWYRIHADYLGPFHGKMFLVVVDSYSKWPEAFQMTNIGSFLTIQKFKEVFLRFGFPIHLVTDNGASFKSKEFQGFCETLNIQHTSTPVNHPATNGAAERFVETFKSNVKKIMDSGKTLDYAVNIFLADYRVTPHKSTGVSPARLMLGREIRSRFSLLRPTPIFHDLLNKQNKIKESYKGPRNVLFHVGQTVMTRDYRKGSKPWAVGTIIEESIPGTTYILDVDGLKWKRHVNQMNTCSQGVN